MENTGNRISSTSATPYGQVPIDFPQSLAALQGAYSQLFVADKGLAHARHARQGRKRNAGPQRQKSALGGVHRRTPPPTPRPIPARAFASCSTGRPPHRCAAVRSTKSCRACSATGRTNPAPHTAMRKAMSHGAGEDGRVQSSTRPIPSMPMPMAVRVPVA